MFPNFKKEELEDIADSTLNLSDAVESVLSSMVDDKGEEDTKQEEEIMEIHQIPCEDPSELVDLLKSKFIKGQNLCFQVNRHGVWKDASTFYKKATQRVEELYRPFEVSDRNLLS